MKIKDIVAFIVLIIVFFSFVAAISSENVKAKTNIEPDSPQSPIQKYFDTKKILWTFDDYLIHKNHHPPHKGFHGLSSRINGYGGHVNIMVIFTTDSNINAFGNILRNYSVIDDFGWDQEKIKRSLEFFSRDNVYPQCHGWSNSANLNNASLEFAYDIINFTLWNWKNNYNIKPNFFIGHSTGGNHNITLALKEFSNKYWTVYGENFRWYDPDLFENPSRESPAVEYIGKAKYVAMFDPLFGCNWDNPCKTIEEAKKLFMDSSENKEILFIRGHPDFLNNSDDETKKYLKLWEDWIDWIYQNHNLININHTEAIHYIVDRDNFRVGKISPYKYIIDLSNCNFNHRVIVSQPNIREYHNWTLSDDKGNIIDNVYDDIVIELKSNTKYYFITSERNVVLNEVYPIVSEDYTEPSPGFEIVFLIVAIIVLAYITSGKKK